MKKKVLDVSFEGDKLHFDLEKLDSLDKMQLGLLRSGLKTALLDVDKALQSNGPINLLEINVGKEGIGVSLNKSLVNDMPTSMVTTVSEVFINVLGEILSLKGVEHEVRFEELKRPVKKVPRNEVN